MLWPYRTRPFGNTKEKSCLLFELIVSVNTFRLFARKAQSLEVLLQLDQASPFFEENSGLVTVQHRAVRANGRREHNTRTEMQA